MARKKNKTSKNKSKDTKNIDSNDNSKSQKSNSVPWSPKKVAEELKTEGEAEAVRLLRWLELTAISNGNTLDMKLLKKQLKENFGIELNKAEESRSKEKPIAEKLEKLKIKKWQQEQ